MAGTRSAPVNQEGTIGRKESKSVAADDDLIIAALKDGAIRNLARGKSKGNNSAAKTRKSERRVDTVRGTEHTETISSKSKSNGEHLTSKKIKSKGGVKIVEKEDGVKADIGEKKNKEHMKTPMKRKRGADGDIVQTYLSSLERNSSRLRPRKEVPAFRMVDLDENDNDRIVGKKIKVYWSGSRRWFTGRIRGFNDKKRLHRILYEDGDKEELDLRKERFELEIMPTEGFNMRTETYSGKKKLGALDGGELRAEILKEESGEVGDAEKVTRSSEPKKENSSKKAGKRRSSKLRGKKTKIKNAEDSIAKNDVDVLPEDGDQLMTDKVCDAAFGEAHSEREHVEVKEMWSYNSDSEKTETDDSIVVAKLAKRHASSKKKAMPKPAKVRSSKSSTRKESSQGKKQDADMEVDVHHDEFKMKSVDDNVNIKEAVEVSDQNELNKTEALAIEASEENGEVSCEAQATQPDLNAEKNKISLLDGKVSGDSGNEAETQKGMENIATSEDIMGSLSSNLCGVKNNVEDAAANVEVAVDTAIFKEELMSGEINVQVPRNVDTNNETVKRNDETDAVLIAEAEGSCEVSVDLLPTILKVPEEESPEILQEKLKTENDKSQDDISKKKVNLTSQKAEEAGKAKSNDNAES